MCVFCEKLPSGRKLNFRQPVFLGLFVPDAVNIAFSGRASCLISIFLCIFYDIGISFTDSVIGAFVVNAENFGFRNFTEFYNIIFNSTADNGFVMSDPEVLFFVFFIQIFAEFISWFSTFNVWVQQQAFFS